MEEKKVKVRILPLKGIGGVGYAGDEVWMSEAEAKQYFEDGYVEYVEEAPAPTLTTGPSPLSPEGDASQGRGEENDHAIMKPRSKRKK